MATNKLGTDIDNPLTSLSTEAARKLATTTKSASRVKSHTLTAPPLSTNLPVSALLVKQARSVTRTDRVVRSHLHIAHYFITRC